MFRDKGNTGMFLVREITGQQDNSFSPKVGDIAAVKVDENNMEIRIILKTKEADIWKGEIVSSHPEIKGRTSSERLEEIRRDEEFISSNKLSNGSNISINESKIFGLYRE